MVIVKQMPIFNGIFEMTSLRDKMGLGEVDILWDQQKGDHVILSAEGANIFERRLPGEGICSNVIIGDVVASEQPAQIPGRDLWGQQFDAFVASLFARDGIQTTFFLPNNDSCGI